MITYYNIVFLNWHDFDNNPKVNGNNRKFLKIILIVVGIIIVGAFGVTIWVSQHYKTVIRERLPGWVSKSTDSLYYISFEDISINILTRRIAIDNIKIWHDTAQARRLHERGMAPHYFYAMNIPKATAKSIAWEELIGDKNLGCGELSFYKPKIIVTYRPELADSLKDTVKKEPQVDKVFFDEIRLTDGTLIYRTEKQKGSSLVYANGVNISFTDWVYEPGKPQDSSRFLFAERGLIEIKDLIHKKDKFLYSIRTKGVYFDSQSDTLALLGFRLAASVSKQEYYRQAGMQKDMFDLDFPLVTFSRFDWNALMKKGHLKCGEITLKNPVVKDYFSRLAPPNTQSKYGKYPHQILQKLDLPLNIPKITLQNANGSYTEVSDATKQAGTLLFTGVNGSITNVTNIPEAIEKDKNCIVDLRGKFMRRSDISATFNFLLGSKNGAFSVNAALKNLDAVQLNSVAKALALAEIKSVHISRMDVSIQGNERYARSKFSMKYSDLKLSLHKLNDDSSATKRRGLLSFLANNILLYPENPMPGQDLRTANTYIHRDQYKSFFNLIWKNIFEGVISTVSRNEDLINAFRKKEPAATPKKDSSRGLFDRIFDSKNKKERKRDSDKEKKENNGNKKGQQ